MYPLRGTPLSRAKDQSRRDAVAIIPIAAAIINRRIKQVMPVAAALLFVAWTKISMKGNPVGVSKALLMFPRQNKRAINSAKPMIPLSIIVEIIAQGTIVEAL
jgi:hypothetical protein